MDEPLIVLGPPADELDRDLWHFFFFVFGFRGTSRRCTSFDVLYSLLLRKAEANTKKMTYPRYCGSVPYETLFVARYKEAVPVPRLPQCRQVIQPVGCCSMEDVRLLSSAFLRPSGVRIIW